MLYKIFHILGVNLRVMIPMFPEQGLTKKPDIDNATQHKIQNNSG